MQYKFTYKLFTNKVQMFSEGKMGVVVEKESHVICVYGTDEKQHILCAIPLCHPKELKGEEYVIEFNNNRATVCVGTIQIVIDYSKKKCSNNKELVCYGSDAWGQDVQMEWGEI